MNLLTQNPPETLPKDTLAKLVKDLNGQRDALERKLAGRSGEFAAYIDQRRLTPADLRKALPEGTALVDCLVHRDSISAFIITKTGIQRRVVLKGGKDLDDELAVFLGDLSLMRTRPTSQRTNVRQAANASGNHWKNT